MSNTPPPSSSATSSVAQSIIGAIILRQNSNINQNNPTGQFYISFHSRIRPRITRAASVKTDIYGVVAKDTSQHAIITRFLEYLGRVRSSILARHQDCRMTRICIKRTFLLYCLSSMDSNGTSYISTLPTRSKRHCCQKFPFHNNCTKAADS